MGSLECRLASIPLEVERATRPDHLPWSVRIRPFIGGFAISLAVIVLACPEAQSARLEQLVGPTTVGSFFWTTLMAACFGFAAVALLTPARRAHLARYWLLASMVTLAATLVVPLVSMPPLFDF